MTSTFDLSRHFGTLRAETETSFLPQAYLPPRLFRQMTEQRSILVAGEEGSGKTALELYLKNYAAQNSPRLLTASWRPELAEIGVNNVSEQFISQAMDALSFAFLQWTSCQPSKFSNAPEWARDLIHWVIQTFLRGDRAYHLSRLADGADAEGLSIVTRLLSETPHEVLPRDALPSSILSHFASSVKAFGLEGVWVFLDGLDTLFRLYPDKLEKFISTFFFMLDFFEEELFAFKIIVSSELEAKLLRTRVVITRRVSVYQLKWSEEETIQIAESRMALSTGQNDLSLFDLCKDGDAWLKWLRTYAGTSPRGWLELTRPILEAYLTKGKPLTQTEWLDAYRQSPPPLRLDLEGGRVFIGWGEVPVAGIGYKLLRYLYENRQRSCTKSELYEHVYKEFYKTAIATKKKDDDRSTRIDWEGTLDTALYRLRQTVEWDSRESAVPLYIISERGKGQICLKNTV